MTSSVHFKLVHNGETRRFIFNRSNDEELLLAVKLRALSLTGPLTEHERFVWRDANSINQPLETADDLAKAIKDATFFNQMFQMACDLPPCVHLEVVATTSAAEILQQIAADEEAAVAALLSVSSSGEIEDPETSEVILPDMTNMRRSDQQIVIAYHQQLQQQLTEYRGQQIQQLTDYRAVLQQNITQYLQRLRRQTEEYQQSLRNSLNAHMRALKQRRSTGNRRCPLDRIAALRETIQQRERELALNQLRAMAAHRLTLQRQEDDLVLQQRQNLAETHQNLQQALDAYLLQVQQAGAGASPVKYRINRYRYRFCRRK